MAHVGAKRTVAGMYPTTNKAINNVKDTFETIEIISEEITNRANGPAGTQHETVRIAANNDDLLPIHSEEHKGNGPEPKAPIEYKGTTGKYWMLKVPYKGETTRKLMDIKGVYWNKSHKAFFVLRHVNVKNKVEALLCQGEALLALEKPARLKPTIPTRDVQKTEGLRSNL